MLRLQHESDLETDLGNKISEVLAGGINSLDKPIWERARGGARVPRDSSALGLPWHEDERTMVHFAGRDGISTSATLSPL